MEYTSSKKELSPEKCEEILKIVQSRFEKNLPRRQAGMIRHKDIVWAKIQAKLKANPEKLWSLSEMERTGGEPDVVGLDKKTGEYIFYDCFSGLPWVTEGLI